MYARHFGMNAEAFALTPDPSFLYLAPGHAEALAALQIGLHGRRGLMVMSGEVGTGKTTLLYSLLSQLGGGLRTAYLSNTTLSFDDMLRQALADFGVPCESHDRTELLTTLNAFLRRCATDGTTAALVIDEAQNLCEESFENLRLLSNFETFNAKLIQIVLVGQPELETKLRRPSLRQVAERVAVRCHVNPLSRAESRQYIAHRLQCAGGSLDLFTPGALRLVVRRSRGIPRRINILCHNALLFAYGRGARAISRSQVRTAVREREGRGLVTNAARGRTAATPQRAAGAPSLRWLRPLLAGAGAAIAVLGVTAGVGGTDSLLWHAGTGRTPPSIPQPLLPDGLPLGCESRLDAAAPWVPSAPVVSPLGLGADVPVVQQPSNVPPASSPPVNGDMDAKPRELQENGSPHTPSSRRVHVRPGATLRLLAKKIYGEVNEELLRRIQLANPQVADPDHILAGDTLQFPRINPVQATRGEL